MIQSTAESELAQRNSSLDLLTSIAEAFHFILSFSFSFATHFPASIAVLVPLFSNLRTFVIVSSIFSPLFESNNLNALRNRVRANVLMENVCLNAVRCE